MTQRESLVPLIGGLDMVTNPLALEPGTCIACQNYEADVRGYSRVAGYERFDGNPKPSATTYSILDFDTGSAAINEDDTVTGATSGATGIAVVDAVVEGGTYGGGDATGYLVLYNISGTFQDGENLQVSAVTKSVADGVPLESAADTDTLGDTYLQAAIEKRRSAIAAVPGSGDVRGVFTYNGDVYAVRDNAGATAGVLHKATTAGWVAQSFGHTLSFTAAAGGTTMVEAETVTGGTSGATATVERIALTDGAWDGSGVGYLVISGITGTFAAAETLTGGTSGSTATCGGAQVAITLPVGGSYHALTYNYYGASNFKRVYFANGVGYAHEWDGSILAPIMTGLSAALDKPQYVGAIGAHLLLGYDGGLLQYSSVGEPISFNGITNAGEFGFGETLTGLKSHTRNSIVLSGRNKIGYMVGTSYLDFEIKMITEDSGAVENTLEVVAGAPLLLDDIGVRSLETTEAYGDWQIGTMTRRIEPIVRGLKDGGVDPVAALRVRGKDVYRLYYDDGSAISIYLGREKPECMLLKLGFTPTALFSGEDANGAEILFAGDGSGMVYQLDAGNSFDGAAVEAFFRLAFMHQKRPNVEKRYHTASLEFQAVTAESEISVSADYGYGDTNKPPGIEEDIAVYGGGGFWDTSLWDKFVWDSRFKDIATVELHGTGRNISLVIMSDLTYEEVHTLSSLTIFYTLRRQVRRG